MKEEEIQKEKENSNNRNVTSVCHEVTTVAQGTEVRNNNHHEQKSNNTKDCVNTNQPKKNRANF